MALLGSACAHWVMHATCAPRFMCALMLGPLCCRAWLAVCWGCPAHHATARGTARRRPLFRPWAHARRQLRRKGVGARGLSSDAASACAASVTGTRLCKTEHKTCHHCLSWGVGGELSNRWPWCTGVAAAALAGPAAVTREADLETPNFVAPPCGALGQRYTLMVCAVSWLWWHWILRLPTLQWQSLLLSRGSWGSCMLSQKWLLASLSADCVLV
jgi:hypothetical protein